MDRQIEAMQQTIVLNSRVSIISFHQPQTVAWRKFDSLPSTDIVFSEIGGSGCGGVSFIELMT
jgi:glucose-6-phosphate isomerase